MEEEEANQKKNKGSIQIPSYQEVVAGAQPKPEASLCTPSPSFSEAFSFIKKTEFYKAPPPSEKLELRSAQREASISDSSSASASSTTSAFSSLSSVQSRNAIFVSHRQKGNPLLKHIRNVRWEFADVVCDYLLGQHSCALYLSLRYHLLHPDYLYFRIRELQKEFKLRVVLCHIDVEDVVKPLLEVTKTALLHDCTLLCGWSLEECGRYLETIKIYENKPADSIQERTDTDYLSRLTHALTTIRHVNKNDVITLGSTFGSLSGIMDASMEDLARCPGIGERKVKRLYDTFHEPFRRTIVQSSNNKIGPESPIENKKEPKTVEEEASKENNETKDETKQGQEPPTLNIRSALTVAFEKYSERVGQNKRKKKVSEGSQDGQAEK